MFLVDHYYKLLLTKSSIYTSDPWSHDVCSTNYTRNGTHVDGDPGHLLKSRRIGQNWNDHAISLERYRLTINKDDLRVLHDFGLDTGLVGKLFQTRNPIEFLNQRLCVSILQNDSAGHVGGCVKLIFKKRAEPEQLACQLNIECLMLRQRFSKKA